MSLRNSFKDFRRDHPTDENGEPIVRFGAASKDLEPPSKRMRSSPIDDGQELMDDQYQEALQELKTEYRKGHKGVEILPFSISSWKRQGKGDMNGFKATDLWFQK